jgi:hypothetical protein
VKPGFHLTVLLPCLCVAMALFFLAIGLRGVVTRKPFLLSSRWLLGLVFLGFAPSIIHPFRFPPPPAGVGGGSLNLLLWLNPAMLVVLAVFMWLSLRGYMAFGVTDASFREGLLATLGKLQLPHEETLGAIRLPSAGVDLQVAVQSWIGIAQVKAKQRQDGGVLADVAAGMNEYFQAASVPTNLTGCVFYVVMGLFMLVFAGVMAFSSFSFGGLARGS